jgi:hypothetical protein
MLKFSFLAVITLSAISAIIPSVISGGRLPSPEFIFEIIRPKNATLIGNLVFFSLKILVIDSSLLNQSSRTVPSVLINETLTIVNKLGAVDVKVNLRKSLFECVLYNVFASGDNIFTISLSDNYTEDLHLYSAQIQPSKSRLDSIIELSKSQNPSEYTLSYLLLSTSSNQLLDLKQFVKLDAKRLEIFDLKLDPNSSSSSELCEYFENSALITHCFNSMETLPNIVFIDTSFIFLQSLIDLFDNIIDIKGVDAMCAGINMTIECTADRELRAVQYLEAQILQIIRLTKDKVFLFVSTVDELSTTNSSISCSNAFNQLQLRLITKSLVFEKLRFNVDDIVHDNEGSSNTELAPNLSAWLLYTTLDRNTIQIKNPLINEPIEISTNDSDPPINESIDIGTNNSDNDSTKTDEEKILIEESLSSSILLENYEVGRSFILLKNACIRKDLVVVLFKSKNSDQSLINMTYLAEYEDR